MNKQACSEAGCSKVSRSYTSRCLTHDQEYVARVSAAMRDEVGRFRTALASGAEPVLATAFGPYVVVDLSLDWWYVTYPQGARRDTFSRRTFAGCNDGTWHDLMRQVGEQRNPLFGRSDGR